VNITKDTLKYLIKEAMYDMANSKTPDSASYIDDAEKNEAEREISWGKVLDSLNPQREENSEHFRNIVLKAMTLAAAENSEFLLDMMEDITDDSEVRNILMIHIEKIFKNDQN
jgi:hypothetical protein